MKDEEGGPKPRRNSPLRPKSTLQGTEHKIYGILQSKTVESRRVYATALFPTPPFVSKKETGAPSHVSPTNRSIKISKYPHSVGGDCSENPLKSLDFTSHGSHLVLEPRKDMYN